MKRSIVIDHNSFDIHVSHRELLEVFGEGDFCFEVKTWDKVRSNNQNRFYWGVVIDLVQKYIFPHFPPLAIHEILLEYFAPKKDRETIRSSDHTTKQFENYLDKIREWSQSKHKVIIPLPNEVDLQQVERFYS